MPLDLLNIASLEKRNERGREEEGSGVSERAAGSRRTRLFH